MAGDVLMPMGHVACSMWYAACGQWGICHATGQQQHFTLPNLVYVLAPHHTYGPQGRSPERRTSADTRSNYIRTILANGICANMDRLAPDKVRARVAAGNRWRRRLSRRPTRGSIHKRPTRTHTVGGRAQWQMSKH